MNFPPRFNFFNFCTCPKCENSIFPIILHAFSGIVRNRGIVIFCLDRAYIFNHKVWDGFRSFSEEKMPKSFKVPNPLWVVECVTLNIKTQLNFFQGEKKKFPSIFNFFLNFFYPPKMQKFNFSSYFTWIFGFYEKSWY